MLDMDSPLMRFFSFVFDLLLLQVLFLLSCLPVFTVGAAWTALFSVCRKIRENSVSSVVGSFFRAFRENFRQATAAWLILLPCVLLFLLDIRYYRLQSGLLAVMLTVVGYALLAGAVLELLYVFPMIAWFDNSLPAHLRNAPVLALGYLVQTVGMIILYAAVYLISVDYLPVGILFGFSGSAYLATIILEGVFRKHGASDY